MLKIITGAMASGKSAHLLENSYNFKNNVFIVSEGARDSGVVRSRNGNFSKAHSIFCLRDIIRWYIKNRKLDKEFCNVGGGVPIFIDEVQFLKDSLKDIKFFVNFINRLNIKVFMYGLNLNCYGNPFNFVEMILPYADSIDILKGTCTVCGKEHTSSRTLRLINGVLDNIENNNAILLTDNKSNIEYKPVCLDCFLYLQNK